MLQPHRASAITNSQIPWNATPLTFRNTNKPTAKYTIDPLANDSLYFWILIVKRKRIQRICSKLAFLEFFHRKCSNLTPWAATRNTSHYARNVFTWAVSVISTNVSCSKCRFRTLTSFSKYRFSKMFHLTEFWKLLWHLTWGRARFSFKMWKRCLSLEISFPVECYS